MRIRQISRTVWETFDRPDESTEEWTRPGKAEVAGEATREKKS